MTPHFFRTHAKGGSMVSGSWRQGWGHREGGVDESWSQGRLGPERLSQAIGSGRYIHEYLRASTVAQDKTLGVGVPQETAGPYPAGKIEEHLNRRDRGGDCYQWSPTGGTSTNTSAWLCPLQGRSLSLGGISLSRGVQSNKLLQQRVYRPPLLLARPPTT